MNTQPGMGITMGVTDSPTTTTVLQVDLPPPTVRDPNVDTDGNIDTDNGPQSEEVESSTENILSDNHRC